MMKAVKTIGFRASPAAGYVSAETLNHPLVGRSDVSAETLSHPLVGRSDVPAETLGRPLVGHSEVSAETCAVRIP